MTAAMLDSLNEAQRRAAEHDGGPLLIIAGAGSGKTNVLAHRVARLIAGGADPRRILLMTFSRRAAAELKNRTRKICAATLGNDAEILADALHHAGTFHSIGARILRELAPNIGLDPDFTLHDREDSADLINLLRHELGFSTTEKRFPTKGTCLAIYSRAVNAQEELGETLKNHFPWCAEWETGLKTIFAAYVEAKQAQNVLDYDDLLLYWAEICADPELAAEMGGRFDHVLVDEYQDTNRLQAAILRGLKPDGRGVTVVGDDAQSIYAFRAAEVQNILQFPTQYDPPATIVTLERNYRSTQPILAAANAVIARAEQRFAKNLWSDRASDRKPALVAVRDDADQARFIADEILRNREQGQKLKEQAALFRASHHSGALEIELTQRKIPFVKFGGLKFLDSAHVKDILAVLRFAQNPRDKIAGFRILQLLPGVGPTNARRTLDAMALSPDPLAALKNRPAPSKGAPTKNAEDWTALAETLAQLAKGVDWPVDVALARQWHRPHLERIHEDFITRALDLDQLEQIAASFPSREKFLTELTLDRPEATSAEAGVPLRDEDYFILSTIHSAKGQEWKSVFVLNVVDGCMPSDLATGSSAEIEEERRLLYVAMTRARDQLKLMVPQRFFIHGQPARGDRHVFCARSRFLPDSLLDFFERETFPKAEAVGAKPGALGQARDFSARMRARWG